MKNILKLLKIYASITILAGVLISIPFVLYLKVLPAVASSQRLVNYAEKTIGNILKVDIDIKNPVLETGLNSNIGFKVDSFKISKDKKDYFVLTKFNSSVSYAQILKKTIVLNRLGADFIYVDVNKLLTLIPGQKEEKKEPQKFDWTIDWFNALFYVKQCIVLYDIDKTTSLKVDARKLVVTDFKEPKIVHFNVAAFVKKNDHEMKFFISDRSSVFIKDKQLSMEKGILFVNDSKMYINAHAKKGDFDLKVYADDFDLKNVIELLRSNLVMPNGEEMLSFYKDIDGSFDFIIELTKKEVFAPGADATICNLILKQLINEANTRLETDTISCIEGLQAAGILLDTDLYIPDNFLLQEDGVTFLYNRYEIAPYSMGDFQLTVPYTEIETFLQNTPHR